MAGIVALTNGSPHSWIVMNAIAEVHGPMTVLVEPPESKTVLLRRRMKRQGVITVAGQVGFVVLQKLMARRSRKRIVEILRNANTHPFPHEGAKIIPVPTVNAAETLERIATLAPDVIVVFGTRMLARQTLAAIKVPIINFHSGLNPKYRGQAGGYWALARGDAAHAGVTAHLVDAGVDTGDVLYQATFAATPKDDFNTYFYLQALAIRPLAVKAVADALARTMKPFKPALPSQQFYHPTLWGYLWTGFTRGVW